MFNRVGLKPWLIAIAHIKNALRTSRERYQIRHRKERETFFHVKVAKLEKLFRA